MDSPRTQMNNMDYTDELAQDITAYNSLQTEQDKRDFLDNQCQKIAQMTPEQRQLHQAAIAQQVDQIVRRVERDHCSATA